MKPSLKRYVSLFVAFAAIAIVSGCSGSSSTTANSTAGALGLPSAEMKCNGDSCIN